MTYYPEKPKDTFDCFKNGFFVPENVIIIGTMNDIDKSVEAFDFAMRRRFRWVEVKTESVMETALQGMLLKDKDKNEYKDQINKLSGQLNNMNEDLKDVLEKYGLSEAYCLGPALFKNYKLSERDKNKINTGSLWELYNSGIKLTLKEYARGRRDNLENELLSVFVTMIKQIENDQKGNET